MRYRRAETNDLPRIKVLEESSELAAWTIDDYQSALISNHHLLVVSEYGDVITGFIFLRIMVSPEGAGLFEILNIAVASEFRRQGIGSRLVSESILLSKIPRGTVELELRESNRAAMNLYQSLGFSVVGSRPGYYSNPPETAILMTLRF